MIYLTPNEVIGINERQIGPGGLRDRHLLESAVERPQSSAFGEDAYPDVHTKAAALLQSLARNHPFVDGNKRTALLATVGFYGLNDFRFVGDEVDVIHLVIDVAVGNVSDVGIIAEHLRKMTVPLD